MSMQAERTAMDIKSAARSQSQVDASPTTGSPGDISSPAGSLAVAEACSTPLVGEPISETAAAGLARGFRALADPVRLRLVSLIGAHQGGEVCVCELTTAFALTQPTISHHLKVLREAGIIDCERRGTWVYYWIVPAALERMAVLLSMPARRSSLPQQAGSSESSA
jgi:ArsR family transcriptional regulator